MRDLLLWLSTALAMGGCTTYRIASAEDQGSMNVVKLETVRSTFALLWSETEHQFWLCQDKGDELDCHRSCGGMNDLQCPSTVYSDGGMTTNTR